MTFDWSSFIDEKQDDRPIASADEKALPLIPDGTHVGEIKWAGYQQKDWAKKPQNPDGDCLTVKIAVHGYKPVWESIACNYFGKVCALCAAASVNPPSKQSPNWDETQLVGRMVTIETLLGVSKAGNEYVRVERLKPGPKPLPPELAKAMPRKPAKAATPASSMPLDDIPF